MFTRNGKNQIPKNRSREMLRRTAWTALLLVLCLTLAPGATPKAADAPCCAVTAVDTRTGLVRARETASGRNFEFVVTDARQRASLRPGQAVEADFRAQQASLPPRRQRYRITKVSAPSRTATGSKARAPQKGNANRLQPERPAQAQMPIVKSVYFLGVKQTVKGSGGVSVTGGRELRGRVELSGAAPCVWNCGKETLTGQKSGGLPVQLSVSDPALAETQPMILVRTGETFEDFAILTKPVTAPSEVAAAAAVQSSPAQSAKFIIVPPILTQFALDQTDVVGGTAIRGTLQFSGPPASASAVKVQVSTTNSAAVKVPATVALEPNKTVAVFDIPTFGVEQKKTVHVVATLGERVLPAAVTIQPPALENFSYSVSCGYPAQAGVRARLTGPAGPAGAAIGLVSSDPALLAMPTTLVIPAQQAEGYIGLPVTQLLKSVTVTASYQGKTSKTTFHAFPKPDLFVKSVAFYDRYGNPITRAQDTEPFKLRVSVSYGADDDHFVCLFPPPSIMRVAYMTPTEIGTAAGRSFDVSVGSTGGTIDIDLPGLQPGSYHEITLTTDHREQVDERKEGNNTKKAKFNGPPAP